MVEKQLHCEPCCSSCGVRSEVLFAGLDESLLRAIQDSIEDVELDPGDTLYRMGDPGRAAFTLRRGLIKLVQYLSDGSQRIVRLVRPMDVLGLEALLGQRYQHDAIVLRCAELCLIPTAVLTRLDRESPQLHQELFRRWQRALTEADRWLTELSTGSARQRVARLLLQMADPRSDGTCGCVLLNRKDLGAMLGITTESASRTVAEFKREGVLRETGDTCLCDLAALQRIAAD